jgi:Uma2 family endonuclease
MTAVLTRHLFSVADYHRMADAGILAEGDRVELIEGEIVAMAPIREPHASCVARTTRLLILTLGDRAQINPQNPVRLNDFSEPQPDLAVVRPRPDFYRQAHPTAEDIYLLVEISDTSLAYDRRVKIPLYGRNGILEVWQVDLTGELVRVFRNPTADGYRTTLVRRRADRITPLAFADVAFQVADILG